MCGINIRVWGDASYGKAFQNHDGGETNNEKWSRRIKWTHCRLFFENSHFYQPYFLTFTPFSGRTFRRLHHFLAMYATCEYILCTCLYHPSPYPVWPCSKSRFRVIFFFFKCKYSVGQRNNVLPLAKFGIGTVSTFLYFLLSSDYRGNAWRIWDFWLDCESIHTRNLLVFWITYSRARFDVTKRMISNYVEIRTVIYVRRYWAIQVTWYL